jgi:hypothetical protein
MMMPRFPPRLQRTHRAVGRVRDPQHRDRETAQLPVQSSVHRCPPAPWVAARLEPAISDITESEPDVIGMLGDLDRCLGWAWIYYKGDSGG